MTSNSRVTGAPRAYATPKCRSGASGARRGCATVHRRADQRMAEGDLISDDTDQPRAFCRSKVIELQPYSLDGGEYDTELAGVLGPRHQKRQPGCRRQSIHLRTEGVEHAARGGRQSGPEDGWRD